MFELGITGESTGTVLRSRAAAALPGSLDTPTSWISFEPLEALRSLHLSEQGEPDDREGRESNRGLPHRMGPCEKENPENSAFCARDRDRQISSGCHHVGRAHDCDRIRITASERNHVDGNVGEPANEEHRERAPTDNENQPRPPQRTASRFMTFGGRPEHPPGDVEQAEGEQDPPQRRPGGTRRESPPLIRLDGMVDI